MNIVDQYVETTRFRTKLVQLCYKHFKRLICNDVEIHEIAYTHEETVISFWKDGGALDFKKFQNLHLVCLLRDFENE